MTSDAAPPAALPAGAIPKVGLLQTLLTRIKDKYNPVQIWLFGSRARGDSRPGSDWDLVVVVPDDVAEREYHPLTLWRLQKDSGVNADVVACRAGDFREDRDTANTISYVVAREGMLLYER
jgi:uncharacterized protein